MFSQAENLTYIELQHRASRTRGGTPRLARMGIGSGRRQRSNRWGQPTSANTFSARCGVGSHRALHQPCERSERETQTAWPMLNSVIGSDEAHLRCRAQRVPKRRMSGHRTRWPSKLRRRDQRRLFLERARAT